MPPITQKKRFTEFAELCSIVSNCRLCDGMDSRKKVLSVNNGNMYADIMFIAEAPGRLGADKTGIPLYGDATGDNFEYLLASAGLQRKDVFCTNTVLCNPRCEKGNNRKPKMSEIKNCSTNLYQTISIVDPRVVVTLGGVALNALSKICSHRLSLGTSVAEMHDWNWRKLFPLYHPSPLGLISRNLIQQEKDFKKLSRLYRRLIDA